MSDDELFKVGDVITIGNADSPSWVKGYWRVKTVTHAADGWYVELVPLLADAKTVDVVRAARETHWITPKGVTLDGPQSPES